MLMVDLPNKKPYANVLAKIRCKPGKMYSKTTLNNKLGLITFQFFNVRTNILGILLEASFAFYPFIIAMDPIVRSV